MKKKPLSQEGLKLIACVTMLLDHLGVVLFPQIGFRIIGRIAFPIYCFLLAEGVAHTRNPQKYAMRLGIAMLLSEIPFDLMSAGVLNFQHQNVLLTLLIGFLALELMKDLCCPVLQFSVGLLAAVTAELLGGDYGFCGVWMVLVFGAGRQYHLSPLMITGLVAAVSLLVPDFPVRVLGLPVPIELFAVLAMIPISLYSGDKSSDSPIIQWGFYLFYPLHMLILSFIS